MVSRNLDLLFRPHFSSIDSRNSTGDGFLEVFTDGCCLNNGSRQAQVGIGVFVGDNHPLNVSLPAYRRSTNNYAQIEAEISAADVARLLGYRKIRIFTDSQFLMQAVQN